MGSKKLSQVLLTICITLLLATPSPAPIVDMDYGDCNEPYPTLLADDGARHASGDPNLFLGSSVDLEPDGQPTLGADGDDWNGVPDDEDGVYFPTNPQMSGPADVNVIASKEGLLDAWIDFNQDGDFNDPGEKIFSSFPLNSGNNILTFNVPTTIPAPGYNFYFDTYARFRFSSAGGLEPTGPADDGEVEDHIVHIENKVMWTQLPFELEPGTYFGWDELSIYGGVQIVADDWPCQDQRPVSDIHWWGSYYEWLEPAPPLQPAPIEFHIGIWTDVPAGVDQPWSHPGIMIWEYRADLADVHEEFVGIDEHPEHPPESCFKYDLQLPEEAWFWQDPYNNQVYWLSIAAIYEGPIPDMWYWGWKTRPHFFNDDAVRIWFPTGPIPSDQFIEGEPITDQGGASWDLAFELTTWPCYIGGWGGPLQDDDWIDWGCPKCWCYPMQCRGDIDGKKIMGKLVQGRDLDLFRAAFLKSDAELIEIPNGICADLNHKKTMMRRVSGPDLAIFRHYFLKDQAQVPPCDKVDPNNPFYPGDIYTGPYNYFTTP